MAKEARLTKKAKRKTEKARLAEKAKKVKRLAAATLQAIDT